jgi:hypothetical protein
VLAKVARFQDSLGNLIADPGVHTGNVSKTLIVPSDTIHEDAVPVLEGKQITRFFCSQPTKRVRLSYKPRGSEYFTIRSADRYERATFVGRQTASYPIVGPRKYATYFRNSLLALYPPDPPMRDYYVVALLNATLMRYVYQRRVQESQQKAFPQVKVRALRELPFRTIDFTNPVDVARHDELVGLVERMLALHAQRAAARTAFDATVLERQIAATDRQIDQLVYALYDLTADEVRIVEDS